MVKIKKFMYLSQYFKRTFNEKSLIYFEGGLGSQIISAIIFEEMRQRNEIPVVDTTYFRPDVKSGIGVNYWKWELDRYGIFENDFKPYLSNNEFRIRNFSTRHVEESRYLPLGRKDYYSSFFPLVCNVDDTLINVGVDIENFGCIHLRRGDYKDVSMRIISIDEIVDLIRALGTKIPPTIIFFSDEEILAEEIKRFSSALPKVKMFFNLNIEDIHIVHGIMRKARLLITGNSTFSWTAGILNIVPDSLVLSPTHFFGFNQTQINKTFQTSSNWMISL